MAQLSHTEAVLYIDYDLDCDELISRLAGPLSPPDRIAAAAALLCEFCSLSRE